MLLLLRRQGEQVLIDKGTIKITVAGWNKESILLGIKAPEHIDIDRQEVYDQKHATKRFCQEFIDSLPRRKS